MATLQAQSTGTRALRASTRSSVAIRVSRPATAPRRQRMVAVANMDDQRRSSGGISRDSEPEQYWASEAEKGGNPFKDPVAIIGVFAILFPFLFVLVAIGTGAIDTSVYR